jgi:hypothetical protein
MDKYFQATVTKHPCKVSYLYSSMKKAASSVVLKDSINDSIFDPVKVLGFQIRKSTLLIILLVIANAIGYVAASRYFNDNTCLACTQDEETILEEAGGYGDKKTAIIDWTFTLIRFLGSGAKAQ